jgi:hypothetical protein
VGAGVDLERHVGPGIAQMGPHLDPHGLTGYPLARDLRRRLVAELAREPSQARQGFLPERLFDRLLARGTDVGETHAVGREQPRQRMN